MHKNGQNFIFLFSWMKLGLFVQYLGCIPTVIRLKNYLIWHKIYCRDNMVTMSSLQIFILGLAYCNSLTTFTTDMLFEEQGQLQISASKFYVLLSIDFEDFYKNIALLKSDSSQLQNNLHILVEKRENLLKEDWFLKEERAIIQLLSKFNSDLEDLKVYLASVLASLPSGSEGNTHRMKRSAGAFQPAVNIVAHLFGLASTDDVDQINNILKIINDNQQTIGKGLNTQIKVLNKTLSEVSTIQDQFRNLRSHVSQLRTSITKLAQRKATETTITLSIIYSQLLENQLTSLTQRLHSFVSAMLEAKSGVFSPLLLSSNITLDLLKRLPDEVHKILPRKVTEANLPFFYDVISTNIARGSYDSTQHKISILLHIPLLSFLSKFNLFSLTTIPIPVSQTDIYSKIVITDKFLGVSNELDRFVSLPNLDKCVNHFRDYICEVNTPLYTASSNQCLVNHYLKINYHDLCPKSVLRAFAPYFVGVNNGYVYSLSAPMTVWKKCNNSEIHILLKGVGMLEVSPDCMITNPSFTLPPIPKYSKSTYETRFTFSDFSKSPHFSNSTTLMTLVNDTDFSAVLDSLGDRLKEGVPLDQIQNELHTIKLKRLELPHRLLSTYSHYFLPFICVCIIIFFSYCIIRYFLCNHVRKHSNNVNPRFNDDQRNFPQTSGNRNNVTSPVPETTIQRSFRRISRLFALRPLPNPPRSVDQESVLYETIPVNPQVRLDPEQTNSGYVNMQRNRPEITPLSDVNTF